MWSDYDLINFFQSKTPIIDVRAPIEYEAGRIPGSVNIPLMNDDERHQVGTCYKQDGQAAAIELGHRLVTGNIKAERVQAWVNYIQKNPSAQVMCFRGGLRSQVSCQWLREVGIECHPIPGGYKRLRQFFISNLEEAPLPALIRLAGLTGSGKTDLLVALPQSVDLEMLANHRGSSFGASGIQPSQITFENNLALALLSKNKLIVEDESSTLGALRLPLRFFRHMRQSPLVVLEVPLEERIQNIYRDYVVKNNQAFFLQGLKSIERKLGGLKTKEIAHTMTEAFGKDGKLEEHAGWISTLLTDYYDPMYLNDLKKQEALIIQRGSRSEVEAFLNWKRDV